MNKKTYQPKAKEIVREKHVIDAKGQILGRLATRVATLLMGKHKITYSPHMDSGDIVEIKNAEKIKLTGNKEQQKVYYSHSGYPGGFKVTHIAKLKKENPTRILETAIKRMLPENRLRAKRMTRLTLLVGEK